MVRVQPTNNEVVRVQPTNNEVVRVQPTNNEVVRVQPTNNEVVRVQPTNNEVVRVQPTNNEKRVLLTMYVCLLVGWLLNVPATCECISGTDLHRQFYVLPH